MPKTSKAEQDRNENAEKLLELIKPGDTVYTVLRHCSSSGMFRVIDLVIAVMVERTKPVFGRAKIGDHAYIPGPDAYFSGVVTAVNGKMVTVKETYGANLVCDFPRDSLIISRKVMEPGVRSIGWMAAEAMGDKYDRDRGGIKIGGCGQDMGFTLVYALGRTLWPNGTKKPHSSRNRQPDRDGGYALKHSWL